ncbi:DUF6443 domain-containing protein [Moheibacter sediminis]|uniref:RHS repeat-associated core domain-containing protein n=1 Tax=Moheibacter sediminis TaxID=1434700 RepID=A0A1W2BC28_9FLAO|nr:DUF6443 domain-containing protein [Moheibacter sediminis]SMC70330.1 RHS repeat-associated core domain-containing protein [Moheibacter sediminis]
MKNLYITLLMLLSISGKLYSQNFSPNQTYTYTRVFLEGVTVSNMNSGQSIQNVTYTDGLGRVKQNIVINGIQPGQDLVSTYFSEQGAKQTKQYLPISVNSQNGAIHSVSESGINLYHGTTNAYAEVKYDDSPQNRVIKTANPGTDWKMDGQNTKEFTYGFNEANTVKKFVSALNTSTFENSLTQSGFYAVNTLHKTTAKDEDGNISMEYKNGSGQVLMTRIKNGAVNLDTYYVYNQYNQLTYIIPPLNSGENPLTTDTKNKVLYQYKYDAMGRLIEKKLPGKEKEFYVYDREDRVIMSTDTKMKSEGKWAFVKYDKLGRVIYTGLCTGGERNTEQAGANSSIAVFESKSATGFNNSFTLIYYTKNAYPTSVTDVLSVNYYDEYPAGVPSRPAQIYEQSTLSSDITSTHSTKSMLTASYVRNMEDEKWNKTVFWYDAKERLIGSHKTNHLNGYSKTEMKLDFPGNIRESKVNHKRTTNAAEIEIKQRYIYSAQNLLTHHFHKVDNHPEELLSELTYDNLGRITSKKVGNNLQQLDYTYNIRGWLTSVNNPANLGTDLFAFKINYNQREGVETPNNNFSAQKVKPRYNGTIAETSWATSSGIIERYGYVYDAAGRLTAGLFQPHGDPYQKSNSEIVSYDNRGNIKSMYRTSFKHPQETVARLIDNLFYAYDGNRLTNINDQTGNANGYEGGNGTIQYDINGNMTAMPDKGITNITYNFLNLPTTIADGNTTTFLYSADGTKLRKTLTINHNGSNVDITTLYLDGFQYSTPNSDLIAGMFRTSESESLESAKVASEPEAFTFAEKAPGNPGGGDPLTFDLVFFPTSEGFYDYENKRYIYQYKDQTGNVRMSYTRHTTTGAARVLDNNKYYAFGMNHLNQLSMPGYSPLSVPYNYKYSGKELQETGMYDFGWRHYMPDIGRWNGMDQLSEMYHSTSPYGYVLNNPVSFRDPDGRYTETDDAFIFTGSEIQSVLGYFAEGGSYGSLLSHLESGGSFGDGPVTTYYSNYNPGPSWFGRTWTNIRKFLGYKPKPRIIIDGAVSSFTESGDLVALTEPDFLNLNDFGIGLGVGVKNFKIGNAIDVSLGVTAFSLTYDKNEGDLNLAIGEFDLGGSIAGVGAEGSINIFETNFIDNIKFGTATVSGSLSGVSREAASGSVYSKENGWFSGTTLNSPIYPANRMVDLNNNGGKTPMFILGGDVRAGIFRFNVEVNVDDVVQGPLGSGWK